MAPPLRRKICGIAGAGRGGAALAAQPLALRVVQGLQVRRAGNALTANVQFVAARERIGPVDTVGIADVAEADRAADRVTEAATRQPTGPFTVAVDRLAAEQDDGGILRDEADEHLPENEENNKIREKINFVEGMPYYTFFSPLYMLCIIDKTKMSYKSKKII